MLDGNPALSHLPLQTIARLVGTLAAVQPELNWTKAADYEWENWEALQAL